MSFTRPISLKIRAPPGFPEASKGGIGVSVGGTIGIHNLDLIERRFTDAFQAFEKEEIKDDIGRLQHLGGRAALRVLAGQIEEAKSAGEEALPLLEARLKEQPDDTFAMTELSWVYLALGRNADALPFLGRPRIPSPSKKMLFLVQICRTGSHKSRRMRVHLMEPLRDFDICSPSRRVM
jgi:hypothetical protein